VGAAEGTNGFDGTSAGGPALASPNVAGEGTDAITIQNLAFVNYTASRACIVQREAAWRGWAV
jgi:hypothetical protein